MAKFYLFIRIYLIFVFFQLKFFNFESFIPFLEALY